MRVERGTGRGRRDMLGAALSVGGKAREWTNDLSGSLTVEIKPSREMEPEEQVDAVLGVLSRTKGVLSATPLSLDDTAALLEPWLGGEVLAGDLPLPRLVDIAIDGDAPPDRLARKHIAATTSMSDIPVAPAAGITLFVSTSIAANAPAGPRSSS